MNISNENRNIIVKELSFIVKKMEDSADPRKKIYFFSAVHGIMNRIFNLEYDPDLVFIHVIVRQTFDAFTNGIGATQQPVTFATPISENHFQNLVTLTDELRNNIKEKKDNKIDSTLKKFAVLAYSITGNGNYLMEKGLLSI